MPDPTALIEDTDLPAIRALIDISLGAEELPDTTIKLSTFKGRAEQMVTSVTDQVDAYTRQAAHYFCAALLVPALPNMESEKFGERDYRRKAFDPIAKQQALFDLGNTALSQSPAVNPPEDTNYLTNKPTGFGLASARKRDW